MKHWHNPKRVVGFVLQVERLRLYRFSVFERLLTAVILDAVGVVEIDQPATCIVSPPLGRQSLDAWVVWLVKHMALARVVVERLEAVVILPHNNKRLAGNKCGAVGVVGIEHKLSSRKQLV